MKGYSIIQVFVGIAIVTMLALVGIIVYVLASASGGSSVQGADNPFIGKPLQVTPGQVQSLQDAGVDVSSLPLVDEEMSNCLQSSLGLERLNQILSGSDLTKDDIDTALPCLQ